jgi:hypothetical protein
MTLRLAVFLALAATALPAGRPANAETLACPDLATAVRIGDCPAEEELRFTFLGFCGDDRRMYEKDNEHLCADYANYRRLKNTALWESADGAFHAYLSCDLDPQAVKAAKPKGISVAARNGLTRVLCDYGEGVTFVHRTRAACAVEGAAARCEPAVEAKKSP